MYFEELYMEEKENWNTTAYKQVELQHYTEDELKKAIFITNLLGKYQVNEYSNGSNVLKASDVATLEIKSEDAVLVKLFSELMIQK